MSRTQEFFGSKTATEEPEWTAVRTPAFRAGRGGRGHSGTTDIGAVGTSKGRFGLKTPSGAALTLKGPRYAFPHSELMGSEGQLEEPVHGENGNVLGHQKLAFDIMGKDMPPVVESLGATPDSKHLVPALAGFAAKESLSRWGVLPTHAFSLSQDSERVVKHLTRRGIMQPREGGYETNRIASNNFKANRFGREMVEYHRNLVSENPGTTERLNPNVGSQFYRNIVRAATTDVSAKSDKKAAENAARYPQMGLFE